MTIALIIAIAFTILTTFASRSYENSHSTRDLILMIGFGIASLSSAFVAGGVS